jgi:hypothetical protein
LPALLVAFGAGAAVVSVVSALAWLVWMSQHKAWLFGVAGLLIALNFALLYRPRGKAACAVSGGGACEMARRWNKGVLWTSAALFAIALFMACAALPLLKELES